MILLLFLIGVEQDKAIVEFQTSPTISLNILTPEVRFGMIEPGAGYIEKLGAIRVKINANTDWTLYYKCPEDIKNEEGNFLSVSYIEWRISGKDYKPLLKDESTVIYQDGPVDGKIVVIDLRLKSSWDIPAGLYSLPLMFTLTSAQ